MTAGAIIDPHEVDDNAPTPSDLIAEICAAKAAENAAGLRMFHLAIAWAHAHPETPGDQSWKAPRASYVTGEPMGDGAPSTGDLDEVQWFGIPPIAWSAAAPFAAANAMSTAGGKAFLRDCLVIRHRMPRVYAKVVAGKVAVWRARRIA
ncbi:hypothetical protein SAMN05216561_12162, partial [Nocardioides psychrotolerans]